MMDLDPTTRVILRHIDAMGYATSRMQKLDSGPYCFTAWRRDENPVGVYVRGEKYRAEADDAYQAAVQLAELVGVDITE